MKFRLLSGRYYKDKETFNKGDIVESDKDLCKMFGNRFEKVVEPQPAPSPVMEQTFHHPPPEKEGVEATESAPPSPIVSTLPEDKKFVENIDFGLDVSDEFPDAITANVKVFLKDEHYSIVDGGNNHMLNEKPFKKTTRVQKFLTRLLE